MHAVLAHFLTGSRHHDTPAKAANNYRFPAQLRVVAHFHGRVERVHVHMQDGARHFTVIVIFFETTAGSCGMCPKSPSNSCSVCLPGFNSSVVSVWPLP